MECSLLWHFLRQLGFCGLRGTFLFLVLILLLIVSLLLWGIQPNSDSDITTSKNITRIRRELVSATVSTLREKWVQTNAWYQLTNYTARSVTNYFCHVCMGSASPIFNMGLPSDSNPYNCDECECVPPPDGDGDNHCIVGGMNITMESICATKQNISLYTSLYVHLDFW